MNNSDDVEKKTYWKPACAICPRVLDQSYFLKIEMTDYIQLNSSYFLNL